MNFKNIILLSVLSGFLAIFFFKEHINKQNHIINQTYKPKRVIVADKILKSGERITFDNIAVRDFPTNFITEGMIFEEDASYVENLKLKTDINPGEVILKSQLYTNNSNELLGYTVKKNSRLVPIKTESPEILTSGIKNSEKVDVLSTFSGKNNISYTKTILQNIEIRKINNLDINSSDSYFLILSPVQSEIYTHASSKGSISLIVRNPKDTNLANLPAVNDNNYSLGEKFIKKEKKLNPIEIIKSSITY